MNFKSYQTALVVVVAVMSWPVQAAQDSSPQEVAANYFNALKTSDYQTAVSLFRQADLEQFKSTFVPLIEAEGRAGKRDLLDATFGKDATVETAIKPVLSSFLPTWSAWFSMQTRPRDHPCSVLKFSAL